MVVCNVMLGNMYIEAMAWTEKLKANSWGESLALGIHSKILKSNVSAK